METEKNPTCVEPQEPNPLNKQNIKNLLFLFLIATISLFLLFKNVIYILILSLNLCKSKHKCYGSQTVCRSTLGCYKKLMRMLGLLDAVFLSGSEFIKLHKNSWNLARPFPSIAPWVSQMWHQQKPWPLAELRKVLSSVVAWRELKPNRWFFASAPAK